MEFPEYEYELECKHNHTIIFPGWVEHAVKEVSIEDSDYFAGMGRYCVSNFMCYRDDDKLDKDADAGDYVKDFQKSDAPQFKGKSKKKKQKMAIAAYLDAQEDK